MLKKISIYPSGPQLIAKAKKIYKYLGKPEFEGSSGWFSKWMKRHYVKRVTITGESGDVSGDTVTSWKESLPEILRGYDEEKIFLIYMKQVVSGRHCQTVVLVKKENNARAGKKASEDLQ